MDSNSDRLRHLTLKVDASHPEFLKGMDIWLRLGLISEVQVKQLSHHYLSCPLPEPVAVPLLKPVAVPDSVATAKTTPASQPIPLFSKAWQAFKDELSVRWLLFLGLFLVVVSSGVLATTQWQRFPAIGQYGVLWTYTLIFWGISFWAGGQENLRLTRRTLQAIALLLVPLNVWAMDTFGLWRYPGQWPLAAVASLSLSAIVILPKQRQRRWLSPPLAVFLGLAHLHWGWSSGFPLVAVYLGTLATVLTLLIFPALRTRATRIGTGFIVYALSVLLVRAIFVVYVPISQLGLVIGSCGWLLARERTRAGNAPSDLRSSRLKLLEQVGAGLLFFGWIVCVGRRVPWQATAISGLATQWCYQRLQRYWLRRDVLAIFIIGLQALLLLGQLIPPQLRRDAIAFSVQVAHSEAYPQSVYSLTLFPYVIVFVWFTDWLYRQNQDELARFGEWLTLGLGIGLTLIGLLNPTWRSLNLILSTATLIFVTYRRFTVFSLYFTKSEEAPSSHGEAARSWGPPNERLLNPKGGVSLTHFIGLLTVCSAIDWGFPNLSQSFWAAILLTLTVAEWIVSSRRPNAGYRSCWHYGFVLAGISYILWLQLIPGASVRLGLLWLFVPLTLTWVASQEHRQQTAAVASCLTLLLAQLLTVWQPETRAMGLAMATGLMVVNTCYLRTLVAAVGNFAFAFAFTITLLEQQLSLSGWFLAGAVAVFLLWLLKALLARSSNTIVQLYAQAADGWAIALSVVELAALTLYYLNFNFLQAQEQLLLASMLIGGAIVYRYWQQPIDWTVWSVAWAVELGIAEAVLLTGGDLLTLAVASSVLALGSLWFTRQGFRQFLPIASLKALPLAFAAIAIACRLPAFTAYTGLITLSVALTGLGVGTRYPNGKAITYLSLAGISLAGYELVLYPMLQAPQGSLADGFTLLASVAAAIALVYRILVWQWQSRDRATFFNLNLEEILVVAHLHWAAASLLKLLAAYLAVEGNPQLTPVSFGVSLFLAAYALVQARQADASSNQNASDWWVYVGLVEIVATALYARLIWTQLSIFDPWRIVLTCGVALWLYQVPWQHFGWRATPWHRTALTIPALMTLATSYSVSYFSLLVVAAFYAQVGIRQRNIRWSYVSLGFIDWAIIRWLWESSFSDLGYATVIGLSLLYIAQFDPQLRTSQQRQSRHYLRFLGSGIINSAALLHQDTGILPAAVSLATILTGIALQVRAFLFVGTAAFIGNAFYQLVVLIATYAFLKWIIGLVVGIILISIAANFERRREQITVVVHHWLERLNQWE